MAHWSNEDSGNEYQGTDTTMTNLKIFGLTLLTAILYACPAAAQHSAVLSWPASATPNATYSVKRSSVTGGPYAPIKITLAALTYTDDGLKAATTVCYVVTATAPGFDESDNSNEFCGTTGNDKAAAPSGLTVVIK